MVVDITKQIPVVRVAANGSLNRKKTYSLKMSANGQVTIPKEMREELDWHPGDVLLFVPRKHGFVVEKQLSLREELEQWRKSLSPKTNEIIKRTAGWTVNQYHEYFDNLPENIARMEKEYGIKES